jgi:iron complex outermembrane receptor protein
MSDIRVARASRKRRLQLTASFAVLAAAMAAAPLSASAADASKPMIVADNSAAAADQAQAPVATAPPAATIDTVVVTASRVNRSGFTAPTPTTFVGSAEVQKTGASNIADLLNTLPSFKADTSPSTTSHSSQNAGGNFLDLRGLGASRTLVLVDGNRFVPTTSTGIVDTNMIPAGLIDHVEVVTGGASAAWGSDAVAGVVNMILKKNFEGLEGEFQGGESQHGDDNEYRASLTWGHAFLDGRLHVVASGEYVDNRGVGPSGATSRDWFNKDYGVISNPAYKAGNGQPQDLIVPNVRVSTATLGGLITSGPLKGTQFLPGGATAPFNYGTNVGSQYMQGGDGIYPGSMVDLVTPLKRANIYTRTSLEITPNIEGYVELSAAESQTDYNLSTGYDLGNITIQSDNAFLPSNIKQLMGQDGISSFNMGRISPDVNFNRVDDLNQVGRVVVGLNGSFGGTWKWNAHYEYGNTRYTAKIYNNRIDSNYALAIDSVVGPNGQIMCRSTIANPTNGCVPLNLFGAGSPSAAADAYVTGTQSLISNISESDGAANISGEPFSNWAGPVSVASGVEVRHEAVNQTVDALSQAGMCDIGNPRAMHGAYDVEEGFVETVVPILKDAPFAKSLDFNGAYRVTNYSTSGTVETWKAGGTYAVNDEVKFRVTRSHDIRAPNISEMFSSNVLTFSTVTDPQTGKQFSVRAPTQGNANLTPEIAETLTGGVIYQPRWLGGLKLSVDYFNIDIKNAIGTLTAQDIVSRCYSGDTALCQYVTRDASGNLAQVLRTNINLSEVKTSGIDYEASYATPLDSWVKSWSGYLSLRLLANYVANYDSYNGTTDLSTGDVVGTGGPHWRGTATATYDLGPFTGFVEARYTGAGVYDETLTYNNANVAPNTVINVSASYTIKKSGDRSLQVFGVVNNLFDAAPPVNPFNFIFGSPSQGALYDTIGRRFTAGVRFKY